MNKEHIERAMELLQAMKDGATIEFRFKTGAIEYEWEEHNNDIRFDFVSFEYRSFYPKLTTDVFNRDDCPEWAKWAVVLENGRSFFMSEKPYFCKNKWLCNGVECIIPGKFDASDWKHSLIERTTENKLPEWCKVGAMVFHHTCGRADTIEKIEDGKIKIQLLTGYHLIDEYTPAVYALPTIDEIFRRSSLVVKYKRGGEYDSIIGGGKDYLLLANRITRRTMPEMDELFTWSDGTPIGKWVKWDK